MRDDPDVDARVTPALITSQEAAAYLRVSESTMSRWRTYGGGPAFVNLHPVIRYRRSDLDAFIESKVHA